MSKQKAAPKATPSNAKTPLLIFAALGALFGSGAIIGVTVLSSPALGWRMFTARLVSYLICYGILFFAIWGYGSIFKPVAFLSLPIACVACGVRTVYESARYVDGLPLALIFCVLSVGAVAACAWAMTHYPTEKKSENKYMPTVWASLLILAAAVASFVLFFRTCSARADSLQIDGKTQAQIGQMLYYMQNSGLPFTTVVTGAPESYFATQFAPLWYLMLPVWALSGHSLFAVGHALYILMLTAAIPLYRICRKHTLSPMVACALCCASLLCPLLIGGGAGGGSLAMLSLPLLLWVADAMLGKRPYLALSPLVLCLGISLEVTLWVAFICLYLALISPAQKKKAGWICTAVAGVGLIATVIWLAINQSPVLSGLFSGIGLQLSQKLRFIALLLLPTALLPLLCKKKWALVLLVPFTLCHLVANASVYSGVFTAYAYPALAAVSLLGALGAKEIRTQIKGVKLGRVLPALALCASILLSIPYVMLLDSLYEVEQEDVTDVARMRELLSKLPENASVTASDSLLPELCDRTWLFSLSQSPEQPQTSVVVLDLREDFIPPDMEQYDVAYYKTLGYSLRDDLSADGLVAVLYK